MAQGYRGGGPTATFKDREGVLVGGFLYWLSKCETRRELAKGPWVWVISTKVNFGAEEVKPLELETAEVWHEFCERRGRRSGGFKRMCWVM